MTTSTLNMSTYDVREHLISSILEVEPAYRDNLTILKNTPTNTLVEILVNEFNHKQDFMSDMDYDKGYEQGYNDRLVEESLENSDKEAISKV